MNKIIDVSKHQGNIDFSKTKNAGVSGVMCRCAYGGNPDSRFDSNITNAQSAGLPAGAYAFCTWHYSSVSVNKASAALAAESEANKVIAILQKHNINAPVAIDLELEKDKSAVLSKDEMTDIANAYMDKLSAVGYCPVIYASVSWFYDRMNLNKIRYPLWVAYYNDSGFDSSDFPQNKWGEKMNAVKDRIWLWQYSSKGEGKSCGAESQYIDLNHCYRDFNVSPDNCAETENLQTAVGDVPSAAQTVTQSAVEKYTVVSGDTMSGIAAKFGISLNALASANQQVKNINIIYAGQVLSIPSNSANAANTGGIITVGDKVRVKVNSRTYTGSKIADFVFKKTYTVDELKGDRAVLDLKGICTPVNIKDLKKVIS